HCPVRESNPHGEPISSPERRGTTLMVVHLTTGEPTTTGSALCTGDVQQAGSPSLQVCQARDSAVAPALAGDEGRGTSERGGIAFWIELQQRRGSLLESQRRVP